jgi:hypothetical protein
VSELVGEVHLDELFDARAQLAHVDETFARVGLLEPAVRA